jgi:hypothetical protein
VITPIIELKRDAYRALVAVEKAGLQDELVTMLALRASRDAIKSLLSPQERAVCAKMRGEKPAVFTLPFVHYGSVHRALQ